MIKTHTSMNPLTARRPAPPAPACQPAPSAPPARPPAPPARPRALAACACALAACAIALCLFPSRAHAEAAYVEGEVVVVCEENTAFEQAQETATDQTTQDMGFEVVDELPSVEDNKETVVAEIPEEMSVDEAVSTLENMDGVEYAQPNYLYPLIEGKNDALLEEESADDSLYETLATLNDYYYRTGKQTNLGLHNFLSAWDLVKTEGSVAVAVLDTGCRIDHLELKNNVDTAHAWDFSNDRDQPLATSVSEGSIGNGGD